MAKRIDKITPLDMDRWRQGQLERGLKNSTINRSMTVIQAVLNKAVEWGFMEENQLKGFKKLRVDKKGVVRYLSEEEEKSLYSALEKRKGHLPAIVTLLLNTGTRPTEIFNLKWKNVTDKFITIESAYSKTGQTRHIPLNDKAKIVLNNLPKVSDWVFTGDEGKPITTIQKGFRNILKEADIENFRLYDLRHSFASKLVMNGIDLYSVAELLGHSDIEMTKVYAHLSPDHLQKAVDIL